MSISLGLGSNFLFSTLNNQVISGAGDNTIAIKNNATINLSGGSDTVSVKNGGDIVIAGGSNSVSMGDYGSLAITDSRTATNGFSGAVTFSDNVTAGSYNTITINYSVSLGTSDTVSIAFNPILNLDLGNSVSTSFTVNAGANDRMDFASSGDSILVNLSGGDTITTSGANNYITIGGAAASKSAMTIGATASGTTVDGGLGVDTFTGGAGYTGGNHYVGSARGFQDGFNAIGSCINYAKLTCRVTVNLNTNVGQGVAANGNLLWTDTYSNIQQVKAAQAGGNDLTGSDAYYSELKGGLGSTTYHGGAAGDRVIWSSAGATGLLDNQSTDIAYGGAGQDEFYWRDSATKGISNFGETVNGFDSTQDALNFSEFATAGFVGVSNAFTFSDLTKWVSVAASGNDTNVLFDRSGSGNFSTVAATLKNDNLFADFGVADQSSAGAQQVVQNMFNTGHLVLTQTH